VHRGADGHSGAGGRADSAPGSNPAAPPCAIRAGPRPIWHAENVTDPPSGNPAEPGPPPPPPPGYGYPSPFPPQYLGSGVYNDPSAPFGRHPVTGEPLSDKSKLVGGLLQLLGLFGIAGIGRIYLGHTGLGIVQLVVGLATCTVGAIVWGLIDAVLILTGNVRDPHGRPLRDGT